MEQISPIIKEFQDTADEMIFPSGETVLKTHGRVS
jgi:hypothetical protein